MVPGRGPDRPEEQPDPGVGAKRQPAGGAQGSRLRLGLSVWRGLPLGGQGGSADHADLQHHCDEPPPDRDQQPSCRRCPCRGDPRRRQLAPQPRTRGARQYHLVAVAALQPRAQPSRADLALSAQSLARQLDISRPGAHHGRLRGRLAAVRGRPRLDPLALRRRLGSRFALSVGGALPIAVLDEKYSRVRKFMEIRIRCAIYSVDHRLAPESPHPAPLEDIYSVFVWLHANAVQLGLDPARIGIKGESGGGGFAAAAALYARDREGPRFAFQHLIYPMIDDRTAVRKDLHPYVGEFVWTQADN